MARDYLAILSGNPTDDVYAVSAGTGQKIATGSSPLAMLRAGVGDGVTDNGVLFSAQYSAGNSCLLGSGTYLINTPVFDSSTSSYSPWVIEGIGVGTVLQLGSGLPTCSGFFGGTFNPGDVTTQWGFFANTLPTAFVTPTTANAWAATTRYFGGQIVKDGAGNLFSATVSGVSGTTTPSWNTTPSATTTDGSVTWTCMGTGNAVDCGNNFTQRNAACGGLSHYPRIIFRNLVLDGNNLNAGFCFGNGAVAQFEDCSIINWKYAYSWCGYADSFLFENCNCALPSPAGVGPYSWLAYGFTDGDGHRFDRVKMGTGQGYYIGSQTSGLTADSCISGGFWLKDCTGVEIRGWHMECNNVGAVVAPALLLDRSNVSLRGCFWEPGNVSGQYFCEIADDTSDTFQGSHLDLDGCHASFRFIHATDYTRQADIYISSANEGMTITQRNCVAGATGVGGTNFNSDSLVIQSAVTGITTAVTNPTYGSQLALTAGDFILHGTGPGNLWTVDPYNSLPGVRSYAAQTTPTGLNILSPSVNLLPTISSIVTNGTTWTITFATAPGLSIGATFALGGFTPSGYNGTFTVTSLVSTTAVMIANTATPGTITTTGTSCFSGDLVGTLTPGTSYDYTIATIDDDGLITAAAGDVAATASVLGGLEIFANLLSPGTSAVVWRAVGSSGTVSSAPTAYQIIPVNTSRLILLDTGANLNGRAWITSSIPVPNTAFATTTANITRGNLAGASLTAGDARNQQTGMYLFSPYAGLTTTTGIGQANTWRGTRFVPSESLTLVHIAFSVTNAATSNDHIDIGIFSSSGAYIWTLGLTAGLVNGSTGRQTVSAPVSLVVGSVYYAVLLYSTVGGTAATLGIVSSNNTGAADLFGASMGKYEMITGTVSGGTALPTSGSLSSPGVAASAFMLAGLTV